MKMNILLINHYAGSPEMGMEFRPYYMAKEWQKLGHKVVIIAADYSHIRAKNPQVKRDFSTINYGGVEYLWIKTKKYSGNGIGRVLNIFDFTRKLYFRSSFLAKTYYPDLVIASSTYTTDNYIAKKIAKKANAKYVYEVHDLWPLSPIELGGMSTKHPFILLMQHAEDFAYKNADYVISMLPKTKEYMASRGLDLKKWYYVPNGFSKKQWTTSVALNIETDTQINKLKKQFDFLLAYTGTLGLANNIDILLDASPYLPNNVAIVLMGEGPDKKRLKNRIKNEELKACFVFDSIQKDEIPSFLSKMDIFIYWFEI
jgi:glycosyltransferase involved in cell wall biosynthesis